MIGEIGCTRRDDTEKRVMQAALVAAAETGAAINVHPAAIRSAAAGRRIHQGRGSSDRPHRHQPHRPHHLR